ncbi:hypothetical protein CP8484711_2284, partial [Chlamydia psittaci 84-8471/1]
KLLKRTHPTSRFRKNGEHLRKDRKYKIWQCHS